MRKNKLLFDFRAVFLRAVLFGGRGYALEQQAYAPQTAKAYQSVYYPAHHGALTAEDPGDEVELEKPYKSPVYRAYYYKNERKFV